MAGILVAQLIPAAVETTPKDTAEMELAPTLAPQQPRRRFESRRPAFPRAEPVRLQPAARIQSPSGRTSERRLELRTFMRTAPVVEIHVKGSAAAELEAASTPLEIHIAPQFPSEEPAFWTAPHREFAGVPIEFSSPSEPEPPKIESDEGLESAAPVIEPAVLELESAIVEPEVPEHPVVQAPVIEPATVESEANDEPESIPERVTRPMPVTLHGVAAGRARPVQVFPALPGGAAVQAPRCEALPLRPLMILGPAIKPEVRATKREAGVPELKLSSPANTGISRTVKATAGAVAGLALAVGFFFLRSNSGGTLNAPMVDAGPGLPSAPDDWLQNFSPDARLQRRLSLLRASLALTDYRVEFEAAIQSKALGWVYRAKDPQNFYVSKLEIQKPGTEPAVVAAHYAVIDGEELAHTRVPLPRGGGADWVYKIRFQAAGNHFTTWVQDQKVDDWTDDRIKAGGTGLYSEDGERAALRGAFKAVPLVRKK